MQVYCKVVPGGFALTEENPPDTLDKIQGQTVRLDVTTLRQRSTRFHRKFFALCRYGHQFVDMPFESFRKWLSLAVGHYDVGPDGRLIPASIAFGSMSDEEFADLYSGAIDYLLTHVIPEGCTADEVDDAVESLLLF